MESLERHYEDLNEGFLGVKSPWLDCMQLADETFQKEQ